MSSPKLGLLYTGSIVDNLDILRMIMSQLALPQLRIFGETCRVVHRLALFLMKRRFQKILSPYIFEHFSAFAHVLRRSGAVVVGSCALRMLLGRCGPQPRDLNILVAHGSFDLMDRFLKRGLSYVLIPGTVIHPIFAPVAERFEIYTHQGEFITVTEAKHDMNVTHILFRGPSTADMTCMTSGGLVSYYPQLTLDQVSIKTRTGERIPVGQKLGCVGGTWFDIYSDTTFLDHPCGAYCPTVWRHVPHHDEYLSLDWGKSYGIRRLLRDADTEWRLNEYCINARCDFRLDATVENPPLPATEMPADEFDVADTLDVIYAHTPRYHKLYRGLLYATACSRASLVEVPLQDGLDRLYTLDDLEIGYWVYQRKGCLDIASRSRYRKTYDSVPNTTIAVDDVYTLFFENNEQFAPPNTLLDLVVPEIGKSVGLTGNVLVVKTKRQDHLEIVDMCESDLFLTNFILRSVLNKSHVCPSD